MVSRFVFFFGTNDAKLFVLMLLFLFWSCLFTAIYLLGILMFYLEICTFILHIKYTNLLS